MCYFINPTKRELHHRGEVTDDGSAFPLCWVTGSISETSIYEYLSSIYETSYWTYCGFVPEVYCSYGFGVSLLFGPKGCWWNSIQIHSQFVLYYM